ncbi:hypothetical protein P5E41_07015 [Clostridium perfringens]|uniref:hypothetical protein n=1 Tax=Clostridium perfringens TaxID=1502 RepID=UPI001FB96305|nr:hypothetical protein [Clostridium perfringens]MDK0843034.1 hypothetical protein [Clostridium perfringens]MDM1007984.1 hypothetical protein [Clostridium perfringens]
MEERENKYLKNKNFNFRLGVYIIVTLIFLGVATFKISSSIREFNDRFKVSEELLGETVSSDESIRLKLILLMEGLQ